METRLHPNTTAAAVPAAGPGDLRRLAEALDLLGGHYRANTASTACTLESEGLLGAFTVVCSAVDEFEAVRWLCWVLAAPVQTNLAAV